MRVGKDGVWRDRVLAPDVTTGDTRAWTGLHSGPARTVTVPREPLAQQHPRIDDKAPVSGQGAGWDERPVVAAPPSTEPDTAAVSTCRRRHRQSSLGRSTPVDFTSILAQVAVQAIDETCHLLVQQTSSSRTSLSPTAPWFRFCGRRLHTMALVRVRDGMEMTSVETQAEWAEVARALAPRLMRLAVMLTGSAPDAQDLVQSTFARAQLHAERIAGMTAPGAYLRKILLNEHVSGKRRRRLHTVPIADAGRIASAALDTAGDDLWPVLATLPRQQRAVLVLRYYEDLADSEIADLVGCSPATVRSHASRGLARMRTILNSEESR